MQFSPMWWFLHTQLFCYYRLQLINLDLQLLSALLPAGDKSHNHPVFSSDAVKEVDILWLFHYPYSE